MNTDFQASIPGSFLVLILVFGLGIALGLTLIGHWGFSGGQTATVVIAAVAVLNSFFYYYRQRKHNHLQVRPNLMIKSHLTSRHEEGRYSFFIRIHNYGLGPATIVSKKVYFDGRLIQPGEEYDEWRNLVKQAIPIKGKPTFESESAEPDEVIDKGDTVIYLAYHYPKADNGDFNTARRMAERVARRLSINIEYQCAYGNRFDSEYATSRDSPQFPTPV